jgi:hypothetical protein
MLVQIGASQMTKRVKIGDRVEYRPLPGDAGERGLGTIVRLGGTREGINEVTIRWDDGEETIVAWQPDWTYTRIHMVA